jgi:hypothetical protein
MPKIREIDDRRVDDTGRDLLIFPLQTSNEKKIIEATVHYSDVCTINVKSPLHVGI